MSALGSSLMTSASHRTLLPAGPLANAQTVSLAIQNNSPNPLKLTEPAIDAQDVEVTVAEPNPGRSFTATLKFPQGFELAQGKRAEFSVRSDNPKFAMIKVPVTQMPKPVATPAVPQSSAIIPLSPGRTLPTNLAPAAAAAKTSAQ